MGVIENVGRGRRIALGTRSIVGRSAACHVRIESRHVSGEHAALAWTDAGWSVRDLGSTNGTWLAGTRLQPGRREPLGPGSEISFGDPRDVWRLVDESPPGPAAWNVATETLLVTTTDVLTFEDRTAIRSDGKGRWELVKKAERTPIADGALIEAAGREWTALLPPVDRGTRSTRRRGDQLDPIKQATLELSVSADEERVDVSMTTADGRVVPLPSGRSCHYVLATLARLQKERRGANVWVEVHDLADALRYTVERVNVEIHRARKLLAQAGVPDAFAVVERTKDGRLRIGAAKVVVTRTP